MLATLKGLRGFAVNNRDATLSESAGIISNSLCDLGELRDSVVNLPIKTNHHRNTEVTEEAQSKA